MKILWVKSGDLVPLDAGGKIRSFNLLKELAKQHEVDFFTFYPERENDEHPALDRYFHRVYCIPLAMPKKYGIGEYIGYAKNLLSLQPYSMTKYCRPHVARQLRELLSRERYDVIVCDFFLTGAVIPWEISTPKVLFTHNVEAQIWQRHFEVTKNPIWKAVSWREYKTIARLERRYLEQADAVLTVSDTDRETFAKIVPRKKITTVQTGVDIEYFRPAPGNEQPNVMVFTGSMDWMANEDGILHFVAEALPLIRQEIPDAQLWIVGRTPSARVRDLAARDSRIRVTGTVDDIRPYMDQAAVYVVPLRIGGGTRIKIFEAMAEGKPVVSTTIGAEGLPVTHEQNIIIADKPEDLAARVVTLLRDSRKRELLGAAARRLVEENYSWSSVARSFADVLARVTNLAPESPSAVTAAAVRTSVRRPGDGNSSGTTHAIPPDVSGHVAAFVCPDCKSQMEELYCRQCQNRFSLIDGIPVLLPREQKFRTASEIGDVYDDIYAKNSDVWSNQGRTPEFIAYFAALLKSISTGKILEIGCGEGFLLAAINATEKTAIDISAEALRKARSRTKAEFGVALAERLPFPDGSFDMVVSVGVMEHFLDDREATREIWRVLRNGGSYAALLHVDLSSRQRLALKFSEYVFPNFRPLALARWLYGKATRSVIQPIQRRYTVETALACLQASGLQVSRVISKESDPHAALSGPHVVIFLSQKLSTTIQKPAEYRLPESSAVTS